MLETRVRQASEVARNLGELKRKNGDYVAEFRVGDLSVKQTFSHPDEKPPKTGGEIKEVCLTYRGVITLYRGLLCGVQRTEYRPGEWEKKLEMWYNIAYDKAMPRRSASP